MERLIFQPKDLTKKQKPKSEQAEKIRFLQLINRITSPTTKLTDWDIKGFLKGGAPKRPTETDNQNNQPTKKTNMNQTKENDKQKEETRTPISVAYQNVNGMSHEKTTENREFMEDQRVDVMICAVAN